MQIGPIQLPLPFSQAGLAGYSDRAMRLVARRRGCCYAVTEALLDVIINNGGEGLRRSIDINDEDHPIAGQIMGSEPQSMAQAALTLHRAGYDVIDLNFACPVKKIKNKARGGHMLMDVPRGKAIIQAVREALGDKATLTIKLRRGFDDTSESADNFYQLFECIREYQFAAATVHGRTVEQKYVGPSRWAFLSDLKKRYPDQTILGSGDIFTAQDVVAMLNQTGVDGVSIARGAIGNPWIFQHAADLMAGRPIAPPTIFQQREALTEHFEVAMVIHGEQLAGRRMRKQGIKYSRFHPQSQEVKREFISVSSLREWRAVLDRWYGTDGPGVWPPADAVDEVNADSSMQSCLVEE
jgi:nifR3 family TIM-barrel protein